MSCAHHAPGRAWDEASEEDGDEDGEPHADAGVLSGLSDEWSDSHPPSCTSPPPSSDPLTPTLAYTSPHTPSLTLHLLLIPYRGIPFQLWPASLLLCRHLDSPSVRTLLPSLPTLELGAGCGLAGLLAASLGAHVALTDLPSVVPHLRATVQANTAFTSTPSSSLSPTSAPSFFHPSGGSVTCLPLTWGGELPAGVGRPRLVLVSDCVYWEELFDPLLATLREVCGVEGRVWLSQTPRRVKVEGRFFRRARKWFDCRTIARWKERDSDRQHIALYELTRRADKHSAPQP